MSAFWLSIYASANVVAIALCFRSVHACVCSSVRSSVVACMDFERKYFWNGWRYRQAVSGVINYNLSHITKKFLVHFGPLTMTIGA